MNGLAVLLGEYIEWRFFHSILARIIDAILVLILYIIIFKAFQRIRDN